MIASCQGAMAPEALSVSAQLTWLGRAIVTVSAGRTWSGLASVLPDFANSNETATTTLAHTTMAAMMARYLRRAESLMGRCEVSSAFMDTIPDVLRSYCCHFQSRDCYALAETGSNFRPGRVLSRDESKAGT